ncbi:hypothetical protein HPG69_002061 [Diceros bicornis minor]|uniref:Uncharacterized protein n=1 Tax=Diceros bicornis minor TaxID=77932 RepID=A0A7J7FD17_DICBM|nr:hypothetical protein HPG69_002061 [Diceros bicornis minor]
MYFVLIIILTISYILGPPYVAAGHQNAFSKCGFHLVVVSLFYETPMVMYVNPTSGHLVEMKAITHIIIVISSIKTLVLNFLNDSPLNKDMKPVVSLVFCGMSNSQGS